MQQMASKGHIAANSPRVASRPRAPGCHYFYHYSDNDPDDIAVVRAAKHWHEIADEAAETARQCARLLERWSRRMLARVAEWEGIS